MKFLAVLITLFFYRNWQGDNPVRRFFSFTHYYDWFAEKNLPTYWRYMLCVGVPSFVVLVVAYQVSGWLQGLVWLMLSLVVLIYATENIDLDHIFDEQIRWLRNVSHDDDFADVVQHQDEFQMSHIYDMFQGLVPGLFWFLVLGPAGTLFYVFTIKYLDLLDDDDPEVDQLDSIVFWMEWVPVRITGLLFSLVGNFGPTVDYWLNHLTDTEESHAVHLSVMATIASDKPPEHDDDVEGFARFSEFQTHQLKSLCERALFGWLGVAAVVVILGW
ncbi:MAG: membrane protein required for beta-lactamase induction [Dinoroseobacter sp.]|jgi:membrane protein required for beta-lactamase induction